MKHDAKRIEGDVYWVGAIDWELRDFHGFETTEGGTYNAYLIDGKEPILIDTVKSGFASELLERIASVTALENIRHLIINHIEPDHSGALGEVLRAMPNARLYGSEIAALNLPGYQTLDRNIEIVASGEILDLGGNRVQFLETPMAHWPDSMVSYLPDHGMLFSSDIFGQLIATDERIDHELSSPPLDAAALYYANIILPFNHVILKTLDYFKQHKVNPRYILPDHGIIWKDHIDDILAAYRSWADGSSADGVAIVYDSMWGSTTIMAERLTAALVEKGVRVRSHHIRSSSMSQIVTDIMRSRVVLVGTPTINDTIFPPVGQLLLYLQGLRAGVGREWGTFGSYGWGGGGVAFVERWIRENQYRLIAAPIETKFRPREESLAALDSLAVHIVTRLCNG